MIFDFRMLFEWEYGSEIMGMKAKEERKEQEKYLMDALSYIQKTQARKVSKHRNMKIFSKSVL